MQRAAPVGVVWLTSTRGLPMANIGSAEKLNKFLVAPPAATNTKNLNNLKELREREMLIIELKIYSQFRRIFFDEVSENGTGAFFNFS